MDTPQSHSKIVSILDKMVVQDKNGPAGATTPESPGLTTGKGVAMSRVPAQAQSGRTDHRKSIAREYLHLTREHVEKALRLRIHYAGLAREYGMTHQEIGDVLGLSEARVRQLLRAE